jgi:hypothetical protein
VFVDFDGGRDAPSRVMQPEGEPAGAREQVDEDRPGRRDVGGGQVQAARAALG